MLVNCPVSHVDFPVHIQSTVRVFGPHLADERVDKSELNAPEPSPGNWDASMIKRLSMRHRNLIHDVRGRLKVFPDDSLGSDPKAHTEPFIAYSGQSVKLANVVGTPGGYRTLLTKQYGIVLVVRRQNCRLPGIASLLKPVSRV